MTVLQDRENLEAATASGETLPEQFRRLRGPEDALRNGDRQALRDHLVLSHGALVEHCARGFAGAGEPLEDLMQEGRIGLIKAVDRFDPDKGARFSTYACHLIAGEMRHYLRDRGRLIHEPGWHAQLRGHLGRTAESLTQQLGRPPQPEEIAAALDMQPQAVRQILESYNLTTVASLDAAESGDGADDETTGSTVLDEAGAALEPLATRVENHVMLSQAMPQLRDLEQRAVSLFFYEECSKTEIARRLGISINYAAYLVRRGVENLRRILDEPGATGVSERAAPIEARVALENLAAWIDARTRRAPAAAERSKPAPPADIQPPGGQQPAPRPLALLRFHMANWNAATAHLDTAQRLEAKSALAAIARGCCRKADRLIEVSGVAPEGTARNASGAPGSDEGCDSSDASGGDAQMAPHFLALLPDTGEAGRRAGERWLRAGGFKASRARHPALPAGLRLSALGVSYRFACFPHDGDSAQALVQALFYTANTGQKSG